MAASGIDFLAFSAHKVYAPFGCGVLAARKGLRGIAALGKFLQLLQRIGFDVIRAEEESLTRRALRGLAQVPGLKVHGIADADSPRLDRRGAVFAFQLKGKYPNQLAEALRDRGIGVRYGRHCAHLLVKRLLRIPRLLEQFQWVIVKLFPRLELPGVARVSLSLANGAHDLDALIGALLEIASGAGRPAEEAEARAHDALPTSRVEVLRQLDAAARAASERVRGLSTAGLTRVADRARSSRPESPSPSAPGQNVRSGLDPRVAGGKRRTRAAPWLPSHGGCPKGFAGTSQDGPMAVTMST